MTTVTFLGTSGGAGVTTLAALSVHLIADAGLRMPALVADDAVVFHARMGAVPRARQTTTDELIDGGAYALARASAALSQGQLVLVAPATESGMIAQDEALSAIAARFGRPGMERTVAVRCATFGPAPRATEQLCLPFDAWLAPGGAISEVFARLGGRTRQVLRQEWAPVLRANYTSR